CRPSTNAARCPLGLFSIVQGLTKQPTHPECLYRQPWAKRWPGAASQIPKRVETHWRAATPPPMARHLYIVFAALKYGKAPTFSPRRGLHVQGKEGSENL